MALFIDMPPAQGGVPAAAPHHRHGRVGPGLLPLPVPHRPAAVPGARVPVTSHAAEAGFQREGQGGGGSGEVGTAQTPLLFIPPLVVAYSHSEAIRQEPPARISYLPPNFCAQYHQILSTLHCVSFCLLPCNGFERFARPWFSTMNSGYFFIHL